jgi:plastocyanin
MVSVWKLFAVAVGGSLVLGLTACGGSKGGGDCTPKGGTSATAAQTVSVDPDPNTNGKFTPATVTVKAGESVTWKFNDSSLQHTVTADDGSFDSCLLSAGATFTVQFSQAGTVKYHCTIHAQMLGEAKVS